MENKILELLEKNGQVSMNDDIFPMLWDEFPNALLCQETYVMMTQCIEQLLCGCLACGVNTVAVPIFGGDVRSGTVFVVDVIYKKL